MEADSVTSTERHTLRILRESMLDPALSGGCKLLDEMFVVLSEDVAVLLLHAAPPWKVPGLLLSAALLHRAAEDPRHPLACYLPGADHPLDDGFRDAVRASLADDASALAALMQRHTYQCIVTLFMSEDEREHLRRELDEVARGRPVVWISNDPVVPLGDHPDRTTAGVAIPPELKERNTREMFGVVCATTWRGGRRDAQLLAVTHPGGCWLEWRPDLARSST